MSNVSSFSVDVSFNAILLLRCSSTMPVTLLQVYLSGKIALKYDNL